MSDPRCGGLLRGRPLTSACHCGGGDGGDGDEALGGVRMSPMTACRSGWTRKSGRPRILFAGVHRNFLQRHNDLAALTTRPPADSGHTIICDLKTKSPATAC